MIMNCEVNHELVFDLRQMGFDVMKFEPCIMGFQAEIKLNPITCLGWEQLEDKCFDNFEIAETEKLSSYVKRVIFIPTTSKAYTQYVNEYVVLYGERKICAIRRLLETVGQYGSSYAKNNLKRYIISGGYNI